MKSFSGFLCCFHPGRDYLEHVADTISDWTREEELKREAAEVKNISPAEHPEGSRSVPDADRETQNQGNKISNLVFSDLQTQLEKEEPNIREGSLKVSY